MPEKNYDIFITVGTDQSFDRMVKVVDDWAGNIERQNVFAQIGQTDWKPANIDFANFLSPTAFLEKLVSASIIIGHAGMGTILTALKHQKPILVMPKRASLGEHRNEHQLATARRLLDLDKVEVAFDEDELREKLACLKTITPKNKIGKYASPNLTNAIASFINK